MKVESAPIQNIKVENSSTVERNIQSGRSNSSQSNINYFQQKTSIENAIRGLNESIKITHTNLQFKFHEGLDEYYVNIVNQDSGEIVREIPAKEFLDKVAELFKLVGLFVDEKR